MKLSIAAFKGEAPIITNRLLPDGMASNAVNANLVSGDLDSFTDIGNPFTLSKDPIINTIWRMANQYWLQWVDSEVAYGTNIDVSLGTIPGDTTYRTFITGLSIGPQQTNLFYATDSSNQGSNTEGAYPYVTFPLGIENPTTAPTAVGPGAPSGPMTTYEFAQPASVNDATTVSAGTGYKIGDILAIQGGTITTGLTGATIKVLAVDVNGAITSISLDKQGFYTLGNAPSSPASVTGGAGTGATFNLTTAVNSFKGFNPANFDNGAGSYRTWSIQDGYWHVASGQGDLTVAYSTEQFGIQEAGSFIYQADMEAIDNGGGEYPDLVLYLPGGSDGTDGTKQSHGPCVVLSKEDSAFNLYSDMKGTNGSTVSGTIVDTTPQSVTGGVIYRINATATAQTNSTTPGFSYVVTLALASDPDTVLSTVTGFAPYVGEIVGVGSNHRGNHDNGNDAEFGNILLSVSQPLNTPTQIATSYVYTYATENGTGDNAINQESGPSDPSETIIYYLDGSTTPVTMSPVSISIPPVPDGLGITNVNLYRLAQQADGSEVYEFDVQLAASTTDPITYTDTTLDTDLGDPLLTENYAPPPSNLQGILALPQGVMAGFFGNTLCLSEQNYPFAWPVGYQLPTDTQIVAISAIDSTVLILTQAHPYTAYGTDPASYQMSKETANQGCVSKRSVATHKQLGVIYASGNGLCYYRGQGALDLIRLPSGDPLFSTEQWKALVPSSIVATVHNDQYWFWGVDADSNKYGYMLAVTPDGLNLSPIGSRGLIELDFHVTAVYNDPATDDMYFTPDKSVYPVNGSVVSAASNVLSQWEGGTGTRTRIWERDEYLLPRPAAFSMARVRAEDYDDVNLTASCETGTAFDGAITGPGPFMIAPVVGVKWNIALTGASRINTAEIVEVVEEFDAS